jgi:hypothetical protein
MHLLNLVGFISLLVAPSIQSGSQNFGLPSDAVILETKTVASDRSMVLWMLHPKKVPRDTPDEPYTCPEETRGSYYSGPTRVSLMNTKTRNVINTVIIKPEGSGAEDEFDLPYQIRVGSYYKVFDGTVGLEGKPDLMWLGDYNGDGRALEFALFDAVACMGLQTSLIGFSESQDKVVQYPIRLIVVEGNKRRIANLRWIDYQFSKPANKPGYWKYEIDYRGRGGTLDKYEIRYDKRRERFEGRVYFIGGE